MKNKVKQGIKQITSFREVESDTLCGYAKMTPAMRLAKGMELEWFAKKYPVLNLRKKTKMDLFLNNNSIPFPE